MKYLKYLLLLAIVPCFMVSCETDEGIEEYEIIEGLKSALKVATDTSVAITSIEDGYYQDELIKILLPEEAKVVYDNKDIVPGLSLLIDDVVMKINRSAEDAAKEATPIFVKAISDMTIADATNILHSSDSAATEYLIAHTSDELFAAFQPKINASLDKPLVGNVSTNDTWNEVITVYNNFAESLAGQLLSLNTVDVDLSEHVTNKALDGLFVKVKDEEKDIRNNVNARVNEILQKVFAELDN